MATLRHACLLLAAGFSRRLGHDKALCAHPAGGSLIQHVLREGAVTGPSEFLVVRQPGQALPTVHGVQVRRVSCEAASEGMAASLRAGLAALDPSLDGVLVLLLDQPTLASAHLLHLVARWHQAPAVAVASAYAGIAGVPALLPRDWFEALRALKGDTGARELLRAGTRPVELVQAEDLAQDLDRV